MAGPILYSTNPWLATELAAKYRNGIYFAWVCEHFDSSKAPAGSADALIAPSSNPIRIYSRLREDCANEDMHSDLIKNYQKTLTRLAKSWLAAAEINRDQFDEIIATVKSGSWKIWRPVLYVISKHAIDPARIKSVKRPDRAAYGPESQIIDLQRHEFDIIELTL
jgi:hypothetical protein